MSVTIGSDTTIVDPVRAKYKGKEELTVERRRVMADGSGSRRLIARKWIWKDVPWSVTGESAGGDYYKLLTAYTAATTSSTGATWKPPDESATYSCFFYGWKDSPYVMPDGTVRHNVTFTVEEYTP